MRTIGVLVIGPRALSVKIRVIINIEVEVFWKPLRGRQEKKLSECDRFAEADYAILCTQR